MHNHWKNKIQQFIESGKNVFFQKDKMLLCIVVGLLIFVICLPVNDSKVSKVNQVASTEVAAANTEYNQSFAQEQERRLRAMLEDMEGVGKVEVMITLKTSSIKVLAKDAPYESSKTVEEDGEGGKRTIEEEAVQTTTIYGKNSAGDEEPYVLQELQPEIKGVLIVAEGGDDKQIQMQINEAVQALFGIEAHKIKIVKRKS